MKASLLLALALVSIGAQAASEQALPVKVDTVIEQPLDTHIRVHGTVYGVKDVDLTAGSDGFLTFVAEPGSEVSQGEVVARIDLMPLELRKAEQEALIRRAKVMQKFNERELERLLKLMKKDSAAQNQVDKLQTEVELAQSDIELAQLRLRQLDDQIARATVKAPFSGVVSQRMRYAGSDVTKASPLLTLLDNKNKEVRLYVPVKYLSYIKKGQELSISSGDLNDLQVGQASISAIIPATDAKSQTFELRARLEQQQGLRWATGQLVEVDLPIQTDVPVLQVNRDALILRSNGVYVVKVDEDYSAQRIKVRVGKGDGQFVVITSEQDNLKAGDRVAIRGAERLQSGQKVSIGD
ncbi:efflux RND transporter periplasmic adaptor subunit [Pseudoalteromonas sp. GB56]